MICTSKTNEHRWRPNTNKQTNKSKKKIKNKTIKTIKHKLTCASPGTRKLSMNARNDAMKLRFVRRSSSIDPAIGRSPAREPATRHFAVKLGQIGLQRWRNRKKTVNERTSAHRQTHTRFAARLVLSEELADFAGVERRSRQQKARQRLRIGLAGRAARSALSATSDDRAVAAGRTSPTAPRGRPA